MPMMWFATLEDATLARHVRDCSREPESQGTGEVLQYCMRPLIAFAQLITCSDVDMLVHYAQVYGQARVHDGNASSQIYPWTLDSQANIVISTFQRGRVYLN